MENLCESDLRNPLHLVLCQYYNRLSASNCFSIPSPLPSSLALLNRRLKTQSLGSKSAIWDLALRQETVWIIVFLLLHYSLLWAKRFPSKNGQKIDKLTDTRNHNPVIYRFSKITKKTPVYTIYENNQIGSWSHTPMPTSDFRKQANVWQINGMWLFTEYHSIIFNVSDLQYFTKNGITWRL